MEIIIEAHSYIVYNYVRMRFLLVTKGDYMRCKVKLKMINKEYEDAMGFGRGIVSLLEGVEQYGSINQATKNMGMAYSKAWKIIKKTEEEMGVKLLDRAKANTSVLTFEARELIAIYKEVNDAAQKAAEEKLELFNERLKNLVK